MKIMSDYKPLFNPRKYKEKDIKHISFNPYLKVDFEKVHLFMECKTSKKLNSQEKAFLEYKREILEKGFLELQKRNEKGSSFFIRFNSLEELETLFLLGIGFLNRFKIDGTRNFGAIHKFYQKLVDNFKDARADELLALSMDELEEFAIQQEIKKNELAKISSENGRRAKAKNLYAYRMQEASSVNSKERKEVNRIIRKLKKEGMY